MPEPKNKIKTEISVKVVKQGERKLVRYNPVYDIFLQQMSAMVLSSRLILADKNHTVPPKVRRFFDEFGRETA